MIRAGESWITAATQEQFVPQMVNFDALGGINFKKGCYPGQEIVARAHYRGAVKRRMYRATVAAPAQAASTCRSRSSPYSSVPRRASMTPSVPPRSTRGRWAQGRMVARTGIDVVP